MAGYGGMPAGSTSCGHHGLMQPPSGQAAAPSDRRRCGGHRDRAARRVHLTEPRPGRCLEPPPGGPCPPADPAGRRSPEGFAMFASIARAVFGTANDRSLKAYQRRVPQINALEPAMQALSDEALRGQDRRVPRAPGRRRDAGRAAARGLRRGARGRPSARSAMRHFDVQLIGGMVLHDGKIAEMKTGEGKTLVATLPVYLNALAGKGVHVVTVNDYLARRDAEWMGQIYGFLGLTIGVIVHGLDDDRAPRRLCRRHHLRHQQRVRLRLPARQHEVPAGGHGPARLQLRHRRRGRQHPDRRGAHAADHLRPGRGQFRPVPPGRRRGAASW